MSARMIAFVVLIVAATLSSPVHAAASLAAQTSNEGGVSVAATARPLTADGKLLFDIVFDTHSGALTDDVAKNTVLVTAEGRTHSPVGWKGDAPGGHHRKGVLAFEGIAAGTATVELRMQRPGEAKVRSFRWVLQ